MSNGDDVLDNWEEIDEAGLTNTLHKIQAERKSHVEQIEILNLSASSSTAPSSASAANQFQPMKLLQRTQSQDTGSNATPNKTLNISNSSIALKSPLDDMAASFEPVMMVLHQPIDEYQSANYTPAISSQTVKILRRPTQSSEPRNNGMRPRQPIKTLQQREQEYAEARLRILGSAKNPEDDVATSTATTNNTTNASSVTTTAAPTAATRMSGGTSSPKTPITQNAYNNIQLQQQSPANAYNNINYNNQRTAIAAAASLQQQQQQQTWSPIVGGNVSSSTASSLSLRQQQQESILRLPRGPDGSTGFQTRR